MFQSLKIDLERADVRVMSLRDTAEQLLVSVHSDKATCAKEDLYILSDRLRHLLKQCLTHMGDIETKLNLHRDSSVSTW